MPIHWRSLPVYQESHLALLSQNEINTLIRSCWNELHSDIEIGKILHNLNETKNFTNEFKRIFPKLEPKKVLGMQLFNTFVYDIGNYGYWTPKPTRYSHLYPHSYYWKI